MKFVYWYRDYWYRVKGRDLLYIPLIILLALILRLWAMNGEGSFWFDEIFTVHFAKYDLSQMFSYIINDHNPPLHFLLIHYWLKIFGTSEFWVRISSLIFGLFNVFLIYLIGQKLFSKKIGLIASFFSAISLFQIYYSTEARMYNLLLFLSLCSFYFFWKVLTSNQNKHFCWYLLFTILTLYTHLTGLFVLLIQNIFVIYLYCKKQLNISWKKWVLGQITVILFFSIWFGPMLYLKLKDSFEFWGAWYFNEGTKHFFLDNILNFFILGKHQEFINLVLQIIIWFLIFAAILSIKIKDSDWKINFNFSQPNIFLLIWLLIPLIIGFIFNVNVPKYYIIASPALYLLMSKGLESLNFSKKTLAIFLIIIFLLVGSFNPQRINGQWREIVNYIEQQSDANTKVIANPFVLMLPLKFYDLANVPLEGFYPLQDSDDWQMRIIKKNWYSVVTKENAEILQYSTYNFDKIILVTYHAFEIRKDDFVKRWFIENNWRVVGEKGFTWGIGVVVFEKRAL